MAEINEFDDYLRGALNNLGDDISPGDWDSFAEKLTASNDLSPLEEGSGFDDLIRNQMQDLEINGDANSWDILESKIDKELNTPEISDEALDQLAADNLSNLYIPYNPTHWTLLSHRLEEEFNVRRKIVTYKATEFGLMLLLMLTIVQFMPSYPSGIKEKNIIAKKEAEIPKVKTNVVASTNLLSTTTNTRQVISAPLTKSEKLTTSTAFTNETEAPNLLAASNLLSKTNAVIVADADKKEITAEVKNRVTSIEYSPVSTDQITLSTAALPTHPLSELNHATDWSNAGLFRKFTRDVVIRLGAMTSADVNNIKTPNTSQYKDNGYQQYQLGYGGGIILDLNYEKLTVSTGLIYRRINYYPQEDINIDGSFASGYQSHVFDAVNLNLLTIPMNLQFQVNDHDKKWKIHAVTGASLNVLALNHYNITVNNLGSRTAAFSGPTPERAPSLNSPDEIFREADIAGEGLFEGGSFQRNHYFTANLGIGVERYISPRWSLFIQPVYQHEIFGKKLGINRDRIHTFSVQIGAKSTFK